MRDRFEKPIESYSSHFFLHDIFIFDSQGTCLARDVFLCAYSSRLMDDHFTAEDELFLFETFAKLTNQDPPDDCVFLDDENDIPLSDFFWFEKGKSLGSDACDTSCVREQFKVQE